MRSVAHRALDGGRVQFAGAFDLSNPPTSILVAKVKGREHEFTSGHLSWGDSVADELGLTLDEQYKFQGGDLCLGSAIQIDVINERENPVTLGVWKARNYSVETALYEGDVPYMIALFDTFSLHESGQGIVMSPRDSRATPLASRGGKQPVLAKWVPGLGLLEVWQKTRAASPTLPVWSGAIVSGGELFDEVTLAGQKLYLLVGSDAVTRVYSDRGASTDSIVERLGSIVVRWGSA